MDFLGNPFGLLHDVTSGVSGVVTSGDLPGLVTRVAHGVTDTASKVGSAVCQLLVMCCLWYLCVPPLITPCRELASSFQSCVFEYLIEGIARTVP